MNVVSYSSGALIALFPTEAYLPLKGRNERQIVEEIRRKYSFGSSPNIAVSQSELQEKGVVFENGIHEVTEGAVPISRLSVHNDGVVVRAATTERAAQFFDELNDWLIADWGFRRVPIKDLYTSELVVDFEKPVSVLLKEFSVISEIILSSVEENRRVSGVDFNGMTFGLRSMNPETPNFTIERRIDSDPTEERYFCSAPLKTQAHVEALAAIESLIS